MGRGVRSAGFASIRYHLPLTAPALLRKLVLTAGNSPSEPKRACQRPQALARPTKPRPEPVTFYFSRWTEFGFAGPALQANGSHP
jgi:hypothetical protein